MADKSPNPLQAGFWLTHQEKHYVLIICALVLLGVAARAYYLRNQEPEVYSPEGIPTDAQHDEDTAEYRQEHH